MTRIAIFILLIIPSVAFCHNELDNIRLGRNRLSENITNKPFSEFKGKEISYYIERIKKKNGIYIITACNEDKNYFTIISPKAKEHSHLKIKEQEWYSLRLYSYFDIDENAIYTWSHIKKKFDVLGKNVILKETYKTGYIVTTPDLHGLYYCPSQKK